MLRDLFDRFDDLDTKKLIETVNLVWDNREKIMDLIENLPDLLRSTGQSIESAGESAVKASNLLKGERKGQQSVSTLTALAADTLSESYDEIQAAADVMRQLGAGLDKVKIPSVEPKYTDVMGFNVVSGLEFGESPLLDDAVDLLQDGSTRLSTLSRNLRTISGQMKQMSGALTKAGNDLDNVGVQLKHSGATLQSFVAPPAKRQVRPTRSRKK